MEAQSVNIFVAFLAGLVSFVSPCVLPLVPAYIGYLSGPAVMSTRSVRKPRPRPGDIPEREAAPARQAVAQRAVAAGAVADTTSPTTVKSMAAGSTAAMPRANAGTGSRAARDARSSMSLASARRIVMLHALLFVLGFTLVFVVVIGGLAGFLSIFLQENKDIVRRVMGVLLFVFGLHMLGVINISFLNYTRRLGDQVRPNNNFGYVRSLLIGVGFGAGWTPCIGPTLGLIFTMALQGNEAQAFPLFLAYSLGLGLPFLAAAFAMGQVSSALKKLTRRTYTLQIGGWKVMDQVNMVSIVSGVLLMIMGVLIFTNSLTLLNALAPNFGI